ncbi:MAG: CRTAC1 family protein [Chloroflexi bacterium]|nr:CRTAC1 family protein [Chloroflexota bacterium]
MLAAAVLATAAAVTLAVRFLVPSTPPGPEVPRFVDVTAASGLAHRFDGGYLYAAAGGVAVLDCNADGRPDLFIAGGTSSAGLFRNTSTVGGPLRFDRLTDPSTDLTAVNGAYPIDVDGDGTTDLVVLGAGRSRILRGLGDCRFEDASSQFGFDGFPGDATAFSATWEGAAPLPTLAFGHYLTLKPDGTPGTTCADSALYRPAPSGQAYGPPIPLAPSYCPLSMLFSDWSGSGQRDLRVSNDRAYYDPTNGQEQLWRIASGEAPRLYTDIDGWVRIQIEGMGIASQDLTGDGRPEVFLTSQSASRLQTLTSGPGQPTYRDIGLKRGVNAAHPYAGDVNLPSTAWHPEFEDVNNDGLMDLFISKGNVDAQPDFAQRDPSNLLLGRLDGTFTEAAMVAGIESFDRGRGAALADFNMDGLLDLVLVNKGADVILWRNVGRGTADVSASTGHWLGLEVRQPGPNRNAVGGWLEVRAGTQLTRRELTIGGGHISGQLGWLHFGLGTATSADVRVTWPDGEVGPWLRVAADQFAIIDRNATNALRFEARGP